MAPRGELGEWPAEDRQVTEEEAEEEMQEEEEEACPSETPEEACPSDGGLVAAAPARPQGSQALALATGTCTSCNGVFPVGDMTHVNKNRYSAKGCPLKPIYRCHKCGSFMSLINKVLSRSVGMKGKWQDMPSDEKKLWLAKQHEELEEVTVDGMEKAMETHFSVSKSQRFNRVSNNLMHTAFKWYDEDDLKEELKHKPKDLENALKNAPSFMCEVFNKRMYGLPTYSSEQAEKTNASYQSDIDYMRKTPDAAAPPAKKPRISEATKSTWIHQHTIFLTLQFSGTLNWLYHCSLQFYCKLLLDA